MPKGTPLSKLLSKEAFLELYEKNHSLEGIRRETGYDTKSLRNLMKTYDIPLKYKTIYSHNDNAFTEASEEIYYWAGFIAADGCIKEKNRNTKIVALSLANKDYNHLVKFKHFLNAEEPIKKYEDHSSIHITSRQIAKDLERFNIVPRKTKTLTFPLIDDSLVNHFMRGYFDGDGSISITKNNQLSFSIRGTEAFLNSYREYLIKFANVNKVKISNSDSIANLQYCGNNNGRKILSFLYKNSKTFLDRKLKIAENYV